MLFVTQDMECGQDCNRYRTPTRIALTTYYTTPSKVERLTSIHSVSNSIDEGSGINVYQMVSDTAAATTCATAAAVSSDVRTSTTSVIPGTVKAGIRKYTAVADGIHRACVWYPN